MYAIFFLDYLAHILVVLYSLFILQDSDDSFLHVVCLFGIFLDFLFSITPSKLCLVVAFVIDFIAFLFIFAQLSMDASYRRLYFSWLFFYLMVKNRFRYEFWFEEETNIETME